ncbi:chromosome segregation protein SMC [Williamsia sterculiae]|uniref:Chromosome partition protein Smc n=1 Tax=Williamsia sterculiae TaxID=1344003 RepID=A0A1N7GIW9_9NOCA|nr:chromosome segregation protein SMC [Williamsia sterculiae]SIS12466.1 condensin subunit Smc [Williamsia sterculiae]
MHLKSLTLKGFKSFASATTLRFEPGITCVVGPNGSGKSNVVDALSWVMGEQGAKALRGGKMEDVIFAGTSGRPPLGRAEVTLTIDNSDGALPIDYSEVSVTRRMFRDGAGEYEINGSTCRLMDVQELLSDSGIGREMHVIVGQGRLSAILESRPEDRRAFIEEAAGVLKHRKRKEKAVRKLDAMQANLARLTDLTAELRRQLKPLGRQAEVARRAQTVQADLRDAKLRLAADDLVILREQMAQQSDTGDAVRQRQQLVAAEIDALTGQVTEHEQEVARIAPVATAAGQAWFRLSALAERVDATARIATERTRHLSEAPPEAPGRDPDELERQAELAQAEEEARGDELADAEETLNLRRAELSAAENAAKSAEQAHMTAVRALADRREGLARLEGQRDNLRTRVESMDADARRLGAAIAAAAEVGDREQTALDDLQGTAVEYEAAEQSLDDHHERCVRAVNQTNERVAELQAAERAEEQRVASLSARIDALSVALERKDGGGWLRDHRPDAVVAPVSELISVRAGFEAAVDAALGAVADAMATRDFASGEAALSALRAADGGRASLLVGGVTPVRPTRLSLPDGACWADEVVTTSSDYAGAMQMLLCDTVVADDLGVARAVLDAAVAAENTAVRVVTRDGDLTGAGWMSGGSTSRPSTLEVQASIDAATVELETARRRGEELGAALSGALAEQTERREAAEQALAGLHDSDAELESVYEQLARHGAAIRAASAEADKLTRQRATVESNRAAAMTELEDHEARLRGARSAAEDTPDSNDDPSDEHAMAREMAAEALGEARTGETEARLAQRTAEERLASVRGRADALRRSARAERANRERLERQRAARRHAATVSEAVAVGAATVAERVRATVADAQRGRDEAEALRSRRSEALDVARRELAERTDILSGLQDEVHRDELARAQATMRIEQLEEQILADFSIAPADLIAEYGPDVALPPTELEVTEYEQARDRGEQVVAPVPMPYDRATQQARLKKAQKDLTTLGKVNPLALEEFAALEERYTFLSTQLEDVKSARRDLLSVVEEVDARILQLFSDAYADVEREFVTVFTTLFPGGDGKLVLTDPTDMLTTGIEVEARPPGKKVKRLSLLSGGEKSLTAIAMLVAIFRARPSPFYVMDEVEAALDDTNLQRLIRLFSQLREKSQLIVITHQKPTMEVADALYGVSMRGDGITTVISQRLRGMDLLPTAETD